MRYLSAALIGLALAGSAAAQVPDRSTPMPPAIADGKGGDSKTTAAPVPGENSFTKSQARDRLTSHGYTQVTNLAKDNQSIWRGKATKDGKQVEVSLDYQGNIVAR